MTCDMGRGRGVRLPETRGLWIQPSTFVEGELGVFARRAYAKDEVVFRVEGPVIPEPTKYSFMAGIDVHIEPEREDGVSDFGHYLNHSCSPNVIVRPVHPSEGDPYIDVVARYNLKSGEELAFDYATLEYDVTAAATPCKCGTPECRRVIHGYKDLPQGARERYLREGLIPDHLLKLAEG